MKLIPICLLAFAAILFGCKQKAQQEADGAGGGKKISIVCTTFPQYDWVRQILGDRAGGADLTLLINSRVDLHSYQPTVADVAKISAADLFIHVGGVSDEWVEGALRNVSNRNMVVVNLLEALGDGAKKEEAVEGMEEAERGHDGKDKHGHKEKHAEKDGHDDDDDHGEHHDEHVWLSLANARKFCAIIAEALASIDGGNAAEYRRNAAAYIEKLSALDAEYKVAVDAAPVKTLLFGDRFPFRYLADDYGLRYYAAFSGCSAETEASFETIVFLAKKVDELNLRNIMVTESSDYAIAKTVVNNTKNKNQRILALNSMQSVTSDDARGGAAYFSIMESNLGVLKDALK